MKKTLLCAVFLPLALNAQYDGKVGINTDKPRATLDIEGKTDNTNNTLEGLLIPRIDKEKALKMAGNSTIKESIIIYINDLTLKSTANTTITDITEKGYYYWNGTKWKKVVNNDNIYTTDGTLNGVRTVNLNGKNLQFTGNGNIGIGTDNPQRKLDVKGSAVIGDGDWGALTINGKNDNDWLLNAHNDETSFHIRTQPNGGTAGDLYHTSFTRQGRVGIATTEPKATLEIAKREGLAPETPQGVIFPKFSTTERSQFRTMEEGTMIYNTTKRCIEMYLGTVNGIHQWSCLPDANSIQSQSVIATATGFDGAYIGGVTLNTDNKVKFKLENNSFSTINSGFADAITVTNGTAEVRVSNCQYQYISGGVPTGPLTSCWGTDLVSLQSGQSAMLFYTLTGTPQTGTLQADFNKLGAQTDQSTMVGAGNANLQSTTIKYVASLTYSGTDFQGKINNGTDKITLRIPYTNGQGSYSAVNVTKLTALGQNGDANNITLTIPSGNFNSNGELLATLTVDGDGEYLVKKNGAEAQYDIVTFDFQINGTGDTYQVVLRGIGGIPDRCFGKTTFDCVGYGATTKEHDFIYLPIQGPDGKIWLNNNLGAEYTNIKSAYFNPTQQATSPTDWKAYGSLYQWQRKSDGHELINWNSATTGTTKYTTTATLSDNWTNPGTNLFITNTQLENSWLSNEPNKSNHDLWKASGSNNPCPIGYHVPTIQELESLHTAITGVATESVDNANIWNDTQLRLPAAGLRWFSNGDRRNQSQWGRYWTSSATDINRASSLFFSSAKSNRAEANYRGRGFSVRCVKD